MKNTKTHKVDELFAQKLKDYGKKPGDALWDKLDQELDKKRKKPPYFWWRLSLITVFVVVGSWLVLAPQEKTITVPLLPIHEAKLPSLFDTKIQKEPLRLKQTSVKQHFSTEKKHIPTKNTHNTIISNTNTKSTKHEQITTIHTSNKTKETEKLSQVQTNQNQGEQTQDTQQELEQTTQNQEKTISATETTTVSKVKKKAAQPSVHIKIKLGTQPGAREEGMDEEDEPILDKKGQLVKKAIKGLWNLKKGKSISTGTKNK